MALFRTAQVENNRKHFSVAFNGEAEGRPHRREASEVRRARLCPTPHLTVDHFIRLLACIEREGGIAALDEMSRALPAVAQPISAVLDLCDARILCAYVASAFDGNVPIWRAER